MNAAREYIQCQTIYCVYRVLFALLVVHIYWYILKTDKRADCADYDYYFKSYQVLHKIMILKSNQHFMQMNMP